MLYNLYGTSEVWDVTWYVPEDRHAGLLSMPIGRPIANLETYVLDEHWQPVPVGVVGELCVGGDGLGWGYLGRGGLTAEKFIPNPFGDTGDRARRAGSRQPASR